MCTLRRSRPLPRWCLHRTRNAYLWLLLGKSWIYPVATTSLIKHITKYVITIESTVSSQDKMISRMFIFRWMREWKHDWEHAMMCLLLIQKCELRSATCFWDECYIYVWINLLYGVELKFDMEVLYLQKEFYLFQLMGNPCKSNMHKSHKHVWSKERGRQRQGWWSECSCNAFFAKINPFTLFQRDDLKKVLLY